MLKSTWDHYFKKKKIPKLVHSIIIIIIIHLFTFVFLNSNKNTSISVFSSH